MTFSKLQQGHFLSICKDNAVVMVLLITITYIFLVDVNVALGWWAFWKGSSQPAAIIISTKANISVMIFYMIHCVLPVNLCQTHIKMNQHHNVTYG